MMKSLHILRNNELKQWVPTCGLGLAAFIFVTAELLPVGLLTDIATGLGKTEAFTGLILTVYAWTVAVMSLPLTIFTASINRRTLVLSLLGLFILGNLIAAIATSFSMLLAARIVIAFCHAVFWSIATPLATRMAPHGKRATSMSVIVTCTSLATVLGVPFGTLIGHHLGWRSAFGIVAGIAFCILVVLRRCLPSEPSQNAGSLKSLPELIHSAKLRKLFLLTLITVSGHFTVFTYLSPYMGRVGGFSGSMIAVLLLTLGGAGICGSVLGSRYAERWPRVSLVAPLSLMGVIFLMLPLARIGLMAAMVLCFLWGTGWTFITFAYQLRILSYATNFADVAISVYSGIFNIGIGGGALIGSQIFIHAGVDWLGYAGAAFIGIALLMAAIRLPSGS